MAALDPEPTAIVHRSRPGCRGALSGRRHHPELLFHPIFDIALVLVEARFWIGSIDAANHTPDAGEFSGTSGDRSDARCIYFSLPGARGNTSISGEEFVTVFEHVHGVARVDPIAVGIVGDRARPGFRKLNPVDHWRVDRIGAMKLENPDLMAGRVAHVDEELLRVFGICSRDL